ncbi:MAG: hcp1 [Verrucomicrobiales bacterium]|nr:hcp1 [Verrucomicrobiales bacterium]
MAVDMFLKIEGIDGDATDKLHEKWINLLSFSWGLSQDRGKESGGGSASGKVAIQDFSFVKNVDKASPQLMQAGCEGQHYPSASLAVRSSLRGDNSSLAANAVAGAPGDFLTLKLTDILVSSIRPGGNSNTDDQPMESVSLNFHKIEFLYTAPDGTQVNGAT